jgi:hypothetical protein
MLRMVILAEVAMGTDDRNLLQQKVNDAMRWLGDITLFESPLWPQVLDQVILSARVASAAGDAGLRACPAGHGPARA